MPKPMQGLEITIRLDAGRMGRKLVLSTSNGVQFLVDDADAEEIDTWQWKASKPKNGRRYIFRTVRIDGCSTTVYMHRQLLGAGKGAIIDHINTNPLDNRRINLRACTRSDSSCNIRKRPNNRSGYKGVTRRRDGRFEAQIEKAGKSLYLGYFGTAAEAHVAYIEAAKSLHGEFAHDGEQPLAA